MVKLETKDKAARSPARPLISTRSRNALQLDPLGRAYFGRAYLGCAHLGCAHLGCAHLGCAHLGRAHLGCAYFGCAYLGCAYLARRYRTAESHWAGGSGGDDGLSGGGQIANQRFLFDAHDFSLADFCLDLLTARVFLCPALSAIPLCKSHAKLHSAEPVPLPPRHSQFFSKIQRCTSPTRAASQVGIFSIG